jgi:hypothetical protein
MSKRDWRRRVMLVSYWCESQKKKETARKTNI